LRVLPSLVPLSRVGRSPGLLFSKSPSNVSRVAAPPPIPPPPPPGPTPYFLPSNPGLISFPFLLSFRTPLEAAGIRLPFLDTIPPLPRFGKHLIIVPAMLITLHYCDHFALLVRCATGHPPFPGNHAGRSFSLV